MAGLSAARAGGRMGDRSSDLKPKELEVAKTLVADGKLTVEEVAQTLSVAPSTHFRHLPGGRSSFQPDWFFLTARPSRSSTRFFRRAKRTLASMPIGSRSLPSLRRNRRALFPCREPLLYPYEWSGAQ